VINRASQSPAWPAGVSIQSMCQSPFGSVCCNCTVRAMGAAASRYPSLDLRLDGDADWDEDGRRSSRIRPALVGRWSPDISGSIKRGAEAEQYRLRAQREEWELARLNLSVNIALAFLDLSTQRQLGALIEAQEANARELLEVVRSRFRQGVASRLDVLQQEDLVAAIHSQLPGIQLEGNRAALELDLLTGKLPGSVLGLEIPAEPLGLPARPSIGAPVELLSRRPDLRALRHQVVAADAEADRALAERWPSLVIQADLFWQEGTSASGGLFNLAAGLLQPLFDAGRRMAEVDRTEALKQERLFRFSEQFLTAIAEVEDLVFAEERLSELLQRLENRQRLLEEAEDQAVSRYEQGFTDFLPVITARQDLLTIQQRLVREQRNLIAVRLNLHRVLGGPMPLRG